MPQTSPPLVQNTALHDEQEEYLLRHPCDVRQILQRMIEDRALISAYPLPHGQHFPTHLLALSAEQGHLHFDGSINPAINRQIAAASQIICVTQLERIHIQFSLVGQTLCQQDQQTLFSASLPDRIMRLQRRELFRLPIPASHPLHCLIPRVPRLPQPEWMSMRVLDISSSGLALEIPDKQAEFEPMREHADCQLQLPESPVLPVRLMIRSLFRQHRSDNRELWRAGCQFTALPRGGEAQIQRYILRMERERLARERGH